MNNVEFKQITLSGADAASFLQGQLTCDVTKLGLSYQPTAIANLKGRIAFGIWIKKQGENQFDVVITSDCLPSLQAHLKKYGAFSKFTSSEPVPVHACVMDDKPTFSHTKDKCDTATWMARSIATGNYWITHATQGMFQPQELRLHQRGGVDYDKGCYLGQEVIARLYFKATPKAFLHRIKGSINNEPPKAGDALGKTGKIKVINAIMTDDSTFEALVSARPEDLEGDSFEALPLPNALQGSVAREVSP